MIRKLCAFVLFLSGAADLAYAAEQGIGQASTNLIQVQNFNLFDQYKKRHDQFFPKEQISIFAVADRKGSDQLEDWIAPLYKRYEERVDICGVANLKGVPKLMQPMIRGLFRNGVEYPVMLDWTGSVCESFHYRSGMADIFILDVNGVVIHRIGGEASEEKLNVCYAEIDRLMQEIEDAGSVDEADARQTVFPRPGPESTSGELRQES